MTLYTAEPAGNSPTHALTYAHFSRFIPFLLLFLITITAGKHSIYRYWYYRSHEIGYYLLIIGAFTFYRRTAVYNESQFRIAYFVIGQFRIFLNHTTISLRSVAVM